MILPTKRTNLVAILIGCLFLSSCSCSSNDEQSRRRAKQAAAAERERQEEQARNERLLAESEERKQQEPQYEEVDVYSFASDNNLSGKGCLEIKKENCGMSFGMCDNGHVYECLTNVVWQKTIEKRKIEE